MCPLAKSAGLRASTIMRFLGRRLLWDNVISSAFRVESGRCGLTRKFAKASIPAAIIINNVALTVFIFEIFCPIGDIVGDRVERCDFYLFIVFGYGFPCPSVAPIGKSAQVDCNARVLQACE